MHAVGDRAMAELRRRTASDDIEYVVSGRQFGRGVGRGGVYDPDNPEHADAARPTS